MNMGKSIYIDALHRLVTAIDEYVSQNISLEVYQSEIFRAEKEIVSLDEKELRLLLQNHENELELIKYTTEDKKSVLSEVNIFREKLCSWI